MPSPRLPLAAFSIVLALTGCGRAEPIDPTLAQQFEITIDGETITLAPDRPEDGRIVGASIVGGRVINLVAINKDRNLTFTISVEAPAGATLAPGTYEAYRCEPQEGCNESHEGRIQEASLGTYPGVHPLAPGDIKHAHKSPLLGLAPLTLTIASVRDDTWPGVGPTRRVSGSFSGKLAYTEHARNAAPAIVGPVKTVQGKFDMYTALR